jgi:ubiquinone/menaquinone biosynthesis C-methylase UbiE
MGRSPARRPRAEYDRLAPLYDRRWARYIEASTRETLRRAPLLPGMEVLDIGCGTGEVLAAVGVAEPRIRGTGIDLSERMLRVAAAKPGAAGRLVCADAHCLPFAAAAFDLVLSVSMLHYLHFPERALAEVRRVLRPGGRLVITDWCHDYLACRVLSRLLPLLGRAHARTYRAGECRRLLLNTGFDVISIESYRITPLWGLLTAVAVKPPDDR